MGTPNVNYGPGVKDSWPCNDPQYLALLGLGTVAAGQSVPEVWQLFGLGQDINIGLVGSVLQVRPANPWTNEWRSHGWLASGLCPLQYRPIEKSYAHLAARPTSHKSPTTFVIKACEVCSTVADCSS